MFAPRLAMPIRAGTEFAARTSALATIAGISVVCVAAYAAACFPQPDTSVVLTNEFPTSSDRPLVVYSAFWQAVSFTQPIAPGQSSAPENTVPATDNTAYVLLAPGWDPTSAEPPTSFVVMESKDGFAVSFDDTLRIAVSDATFTGNCAGGSRLSQDEADFITERVFQKTLAGFRYDAATCSTTPPR